jgi:preprotein translocase subunit SecB
MNSQQSSTASAKEFNSFLAKAKLENIRTVRLDVRADKEFQHKQANDINVKFTSNYSNNDDESGFSVDAAYLVRLRAGRRILGSVAVTLRLYYSSPQPMTDLLFAVFGGQSVQFVTWPYLREHIANVSARCNWPRLTLPMMSVHTTDRPPDREPRKGEAAAKGGPKKKPKKTG